MTQFAPRAITIHRLPLTVRRHIRHLLAHIPVTAVATPSDFGRWIHPPLTR